MKASSGYVYFNNNMLYRAQILSIYVKVFTLYSFHYQQQYPRTLYLAHYPIVTRQGNDSALKNTFFPFTIHTISRQDSDKEGLWIPPYQQQDLVTIEIFELIYCQQNIDTGHSLILNGQYDAVNVFSYLYIVGLALLYLQQDFDTVSLSPSSLFLI